MRCGAKMVYLRREMSEVEKRKILTPFAERLRQAEGTEVGAQRTQRDLR
jgi:hypothetical protein